MFRPLLVRRQGTQLHTATMNILAGDRSVEVKNTWGFSVFKNIAVDLCLC
jgi:hypothetical protein